MCVMVPEDEKKSCFYATVTNFCVTEVNEISDRIFAPVNPAKYLNNCGTSLASICHNL